MLLKTFKILSVVLALPLLGSCKTGPIVTVCILDAANAVLDCVDPDQKQFTIPFPQADKFVCFSPDDARTLLETCKGPKELKTAGKDFLNHLASSPSASNMFTGGMLHVVGR